MFAKRSKSTVAPTTPAVAAPAIVVRPPAAAEARPSGPTGERVPSIVAAGTTVRGEVASEGEVHVDGTVVGNVTGAVVTVGRDGRIEGDVRGSLIRVHGSADGELAGDRVEVAATGRVRGRVFLRTLEVQAGASFFCETRPIDDKAAPAAVTAPAVRTFPADED